MRSKKGVLEELVGWSGCRRLRAVALRDFRALGLHVGELGFEIANVGQNLFLPTIFMEKR